MTPRSDSQVHPLGVWSSLETFTGRVCGLPLGDGCWREQNSGDGVRQPKEEPTGICCWLLLRPLKDQHDVILSWHDTRPTVEGAGALCGFLSKPRGRRTLQPAFLDIRNDSERPVTQWYVPEAQKSETLYEVFGSLTFLRRELPGLQIRVSLADLINSYLDTACRFRRLGAPSEDESTNNRAFGIAKCHTDVMERRLLVGSRVSIFSLDPLTRDLKEIHEARLGGLVPPGPIVSDLAIRPRALDNKKPLCPSVVLCAFGRDLVLPAEVDRGWLEVRLGEMCTYILYWILVRVFGDERNATARALAREWREQLAGGQNTSDLFDHLLACEVSLTRVQDVHDLNATSSTDDITLLGNWTAPLKDVLSAIDLDPRATDPDPIVKTAEFLRSFSTSELASLPMYERVQWQWRGDLRLEDTTDALLERIVFALGIGDPSIEHPTPRTLALRSVFPLLDTLALWPRRASVRCQLIVPLWEDRVGPVDATYYQMPVLLAQIFTTEEPHADTGGVWLNALSSYGAAVALEHYRAATKAESFLRQVVHFLTHEITHTLEDDNTAVWSEVLALCPPALGDKVRTLRSVAGQFSEFAGDLLAASGPASDVREAHRKLAGLIRKLHSDQRLATLLSCVAADVCRWQRERRDPNAPPAAGFVSLLPDWRDVFAEEELTVGYLLTTEVVRNAVQHGDPTKEVRFEMEVVEERYVVRVTNGVSVGRLTSSRTIDALNILLTALFTDSGVAMSHTGPNQTTCTLTLRIPPRFEGIDNE